MPEADPNRTVHCVKLQKDLPGLKSAPFPNDLGQYIYENVSKEAWDMWLQESVRFINTYGWKLGSREGNEALLKQLRLWLGLEEGEALPTAWRPPEKS